MAEEAVKPSDQQIPHQWAPSNYYRIVHSNFFRYRINPGEMTFHFDSVTDLGTTTQPTVIGEVSVAMSWPQVKAIFLTLQMVIPIIEQEIGTIVLPNVAGETLANERQRVLQVIRAAYRRL